MTTKLIAYCGLLCSDCPAHDAAEQKSEEERAKLAEEWSTADYPLSAADIDCRGCTAADENVVVFCRACDIRGCARAKGVEDCAHCDEYPCGRLDKVAPEARATLDEIRAGLAS